jgi:sulfatase maturation enzyme AslB (radical SAM superfamily)
MYANATVAHWLRNKDKKGFIPQQIDIDLTNKCNQDCYYCISADFRARENVQQTVDNYIQLLERLNTWHKHTPDSFGSLYAVTFAGGGEPTLLNGYERVIEKAIDCGFLVSLTTNGIRLNQLIENIPVEKLKMMNWIGIDIDAGDEITYELIRKSKSKNVFEKVISNATTLRNMGVNVDFKLLANEHNSSNSQIETMFELGKEVGIRMIYYRPVILGNHAFDITSKMVEQIKKCSLRYQIPFKVNTTKNSARNYSKCHQMFQFPSFCANGKIYTCCDHKGYPEFEIGSWIDNDFRDMWLGERHMEIYNNINTHLCPPCRPNINNIEIQTCLDDPSKLSVLNT